MVEVVGIPFGNPVAPTTIVDFYRMSLIMLDWNREIDSYLSRSVAYLSTSSQNIVSCRNWQGLTPTWETCNCGTHAARVTAVGTEAR